MIDPHLASIGSVFESVLAVFRWLWSHVLDLTIVIATASALTKALEVAVQKALDDHPDPDPRWLILCVRALNFHEGFLGIFIKILDTISFTREDIVKRHQP